MYSHIRNKMKKDRNREKLSISRFHNDKKYKYVRNQFYFEFNFEITYVQFNETRWRMPNERMMRKKQFKNKQKIERRMNTRNE